MLLTVNIVPVMSVVKNCILKDIIPIIALDAMILDLLTIRDVPIDRKDYKEMTIPKYRILPVQEFNELQLDRYNKAVAEWEPEKGGFPYIGAYTFEHKRGYVVPNGDNRHRYFRLKRDAIEYMLYGKD